MCWCTGIIHFSRVMTDATKAKFARAIIQCQKAAGAESLKEAYSLYSKSVTALKEVLPDLPLDIQSEVTNKVRPSLLSGEE